MLEGYLTLDLSGGAAYVKVESLGLLRRVDAVIFDCDGVLIDTRYSYDRAISKAVSHIFEALTGYPLHEAFVSDEVISLFRRSGGFNNDWDTVYGILMFTLCDLPEKTRRELGKRMEKVCAQPDPFARLASMSAGAESVERGGLCDEMLEESMTRLREFTELLDETGVDSVERNLTGAAENLGDLRGFVEILKRFLRYPGGVGESIISTIFEELFCGSTLFMETYGMEPRFHRGPGLIENERPIVRPETLDRVSSLLGGARLGVASGSRFLPAKHILKAILGRFRPEASIFLDDVEKAENEHLKETGSRVNFKKPHPFSLLKAAEAFDPRGIILYVGDSMADAVMAREANKVCSRFVFAGVYGFSHAGDVLVRDFIEAGCDVVLSSVNELPAVLESMKGVER